MMRAVSPLADMDVLPSPGGGTVRIRSIEQTDTIPQTEDDGSDLCPRPARTPARSGLDGL